MSGGKFANKIANLPILLITTFGRKSGKPFTNAVVYIRDGQDYLVSATNGGADTHPASTNFVKYEQSTSRVLPVIRLSPTHIPQKDT
jgi:hypothetical protein